MREMLSQFNKHNIRVQMFGDEKLKNRPISEWPLCKHLLCFHSNGFPIDRALSYISSTQPILINDVESQIDLLLSREKVYDKLREIGVPCPNYLVYHHYQHESDDKQIVEGDDWIQIGENRLEKPFVEKPLDSNNHDIYIYYHSNQGGGSRRLFRKIDNKSSSFHQDGKSVIFT